MPEKIRLAIIMSMIKFKGNNKTFFFISFAASLAVYLKTVCPTVYTGDSAELSLAAVTLGIAHPPGYPLLILIGRIFAEIAFGNQAYLLNILSSMFSAASVGVMALVVRMIVFPAGKRDGIFPMVISSAGALIWGFADALWGTSSGFEVYSLSALLVVLILFFLLKFEENGDFVWLMAGIYLFSLAMTNHLSALAILPAVGYSALKSKLDLKQYGYGAALLFLGLTLYLYLPVRSSQYPIADWNHPAAFSALLEHVTAARYELYLSSSGLPGFFENIVRASGILGRQYPLYLIFGGFAGLIVLFGKRKTAAIILSSIIVFNLLLNALYDIPDMDQYYLPSIIALSIGFIALIKSIFEKLPPSINKYGASIVSILAVVISFMGNLKTNDQSDNTIAYSYGLSILNSLPTGSYLLTVGDNATFPLLYLRYAESVRPDLTVYDRAVTVRRLAEIVYRRTARTNQSPDELCIDLFNSGLENLFIVKEHLLPGVNPFKYHLLDLTSYGLVYKQGKWPLDNAVLNSYELRFNEISAGALDFKGRTMLCNIYLSLGEHLNRGGDNRGAVDNYRKAREEGDKLNNPLVYNALGVFFRRTGWPVLAQKEYEKALAAPHLTNKVKSDILTNLGNMKRDAHRFDEAAKFYRDAIHMNKRNSEARYNLALSDAYINLNARRYHEALKKFQEALAMPDPDPQIYYNLGSIYDRNLNDTSAALVYYRKFIELMPDSPRGKSAVERIKTLEK